MDPTVSGKSKDYAAVEKLINSVSDDPYVEHYGIPGMKWGVRRSQATLDRLAGRAVTTTEKVKSNVSKRLQERRDDRKVVRKAKRKSRVDAAKAKAQGKVAVEKAKAEKKVQDIKTGSDQKTSTNTPAWNLTDQELRDRVNRLNLEKQYKTLTTKPKTKTTGDRVQEFAIKQGTKFVSQAADAMIQKAVSNIVGDSATKKGKEALSDVVKDTAKTTKAAKIPDVIAKIDKTIKVPKTTTKKSTKLVDSLVRTSGSKKISDLVDAYTYVGRRRLNKDRRVTNRRR